MYNEKIEQLISAALADGVLTEKEKQVLFKRAQEQGIDLDEFEMVLDARLVELRKAEKEKAEKSAPKSTKFGDVRKCPVCGALVPALAVSCAECGYEFSGISASSSAQLLSKQINEIKEKASARKSEVRRSDKYSSKVDTGQMFSSEQIAINQIDIDTQQQLENVVLNFPIPNAKHDLFDLILFLKNHLGENIYEVKFNECLERANYLFPNDELFSQIVSDAKKARKDHKAKVIGTVIFYVCMCIGVVIGLLLMYFRGVANDWNWLKWYGGSMLFISIGGVVGGVVGVFIRLIYFKFNKVHSNSILIEGII